MKQQSLPAFVDPLALREYVQSKLAGLEHRQKFRAERRRRRNANRQEKKTLDIQTRTYYVQQPLFPEQKPMKLYRTATYEEMALRADADGVLYNAFGKLGESRDAVPVICGNCGWRGTQGEMHCLGSLGRMHCPKCGADYGYHDGVMPMLPESVE